MKQNDADFDLFGDGMRIFLDYISRQYKKDPDYKPHPIIRAFECALQGIEDCKIDECTMGLSQEGTEEFVQQPYVVVMQKQKDGVEVKEIRNLIVNREIPLDVLIIVFRLQIHLDKIKGEDLTQHQAVGILNKVIPGNNFYEIADQWEKARDIFFEKLKNREFNITKKLATPELEEELHKIKKSTPWEDYSPKLRSIIGPYIVTDTSINSGKIILTAPSSTVMSKDRLFDQVIEFLIGRSSEYVKLPTY